MTQYSFLREFNVGALKQTGANVAKWAVKNPVKTGMAAGAAIGGVTNKMKGGSFAGGAVKGATIGGAVGLGAKALSKTNMGKSAINQTKQVFAKNPVSGTADKVKQMLQK